MTITTGDPEDTLAVLKAAREWLRDPEHWTQGESWITADGKPTDDRNEVAKTCADGALYLAYGRKPGAERTPAYMALGAALGEPVIDVNDGRNGYERILAAYDKAIATLEAQS